MSDSRGPSRPSSGSGRDGGSGTGRSRGAGDGASSARKQFPGAQGRSRTNGAGAGKGAGKSSGRSAGAGSAAGRSANEGSPKGTSRTARRAGTAGAGAAGASGAAKSGAAKNGTAKRSTSAAAGSGRGGRGGRGTAKRTGLAAALNYPRAGKKGPLRWLPSLRMFGGAIALIVLLGLGGAVWLYNSTDVPQADDVAVAQTTRVYFSDGKTEMGQFSEVNRTILPNDEIPQTVKDAVVASEDTTFYENRGVSPKGIVRALWNNLKGGSRQGGSTITQQYVERYYTGTTTSYTGKVKEMIMALKADQELSKDEILSRYLNTIYFGRGAYGIQAASEAYFGKDAKDLDESEAALLVAVIPAPSAYDPANDKEASAKKWDRVITREVNMTGSLTEEQADKLEFPETSKNKQQNYLEGTNGYLLMMVRSELEREGFTEEEINTGGYKIVSTVSKKDQDITVDTIDGLKDEGRPDANRVGTMSIDPDSGAITAMYGGPDFVKQSINDATQSRMQAGSIFKSFALIAGLENGYGLNSTWDGNSPRTFGSWTVNNFGHTSYGPISLRQATTNSVNTAYAGLNVAMGPEKTRKAAVQLGIPEKTPGLNDDASNVLGSASPTVREMAEAYATIAAKGVHHQSYIVDSVSNPDGSDEYEHKDSSKRVLDEKVAINATVALQGPPSTGSARSVAGVMGGRPVAGKTGTSESFKSAWFVGFTPQMVTAVGMFQPSEDGKSEEQLTPFGGVSSMTGGSWPATIWGRIMSQTLEGEPIEQFDGEVVLDNQKSSAGNATKAPVTQAPQTKAPTTTQAPTTEEPSKEPSEEPSDEESSKTETPTEEESSKSEKPTEEESSKTEKPTDKESDKDDSDKGKDDSKDSDKDKGGDSDKSKDDSDDSKDSGDKGGDSGDDTQDSGESKGGSGKGKDSGSKDTKNATKDDGE
ncbi:transglycosylase domain-containing protein [Brachybacterium sp. NPDC056505]|uniref:transglycosylase domain-containing protein n=1 Tax=Brachybacterium sp. NPDC056505 TaxID=3345843 RepID=UPI00366FCEB6